MSVFPYKTPSNRGGKLPAAVCLGQSSLINEKYESVNLFEQVAYKEGHRFHASDKTLMVLKQRSEPAAQCVLQQSSANTAAT